MSEQVITPRVICAALVINSASVKCTLAHGELDVYYALAARERGGVLEVKFDGGQLGEGRDRWRKPETVSIDDDVYAQVVGAATAADAVHRLGMRHYLRLTGSRSSGQAPCGKRATDKTRARPGQVITCESCREITSRDKMPRFDRQGRELVTAENVVLFVHRALVAKQTVTAALGGSTPLVVLDARLKMHGGFQVNVHPGDWRDADEVLIETHTLKLDRVASAVAAQDAVQPLAGAGEVTGYEGGPNPAPRGKTSPEGEHAQTAGTWGDLVGRVRAAVERVLTSREVVESIVTEVLGARDQGEPVTRPPAILLADVRRGLTTTRYVFDRIEGGKRQFALHYVHDTRQVSVADHAEFDYPTLDELGDALELIAANLDA